MKALVKIGLVTVVMSVGSIGSAMAGSKVAGTSALESLDKSLNAIESPKAEILVEQRKPGSYKKRWKAY